MITQKITCDHCGVTLGESERDLCIARVTIGGAPIDDVHGCRDYHLALGTAKALGLDISPKIADLRAQLDAANAKIASLETAAKMHEAALSRMPANEVKRDYLHPISGAELLRRIERMPPEALLDADEHADGGTNSEREQYEITIERLNERIAELEKQLGVALEERDNARGELAARMAMLTPIDANGRTPGEVDHGARHEEMVCRGFVSLRWEELTKDEQEVIDIGAQAVLRAFGPAIAAKALTDLCETITHDDDPTGYFAGKINAAIERLNAHTNLAPTKQSMREYASKFVADMAKVFPEPSAIQQLEYMLRWFWREEEGK